MKMPMLNRQMKYSKRKRRRHNSLKGEEINMEERYRMENCPKEYTWKI